MKKNRLTAVIVFAAMLFSAVMYCPTAVQAEDLKPESDWSNNVYSNQNKCFLVPRGAGWIRAIYKDDQFYVDFLDSSFKVTGKKTIDLELPLYGGFYAGEDGYYYLVVGQENTSESMSAEVVRVIKYDTDFNRIGAASITSTDQLGWIDYGQVRVPFDFGGFAAAEADGKMLIACGHEGFVDESIGQGHQGLMLMYVDTESMTGEMVGGDLWHSFDQQLVYDNGSFYLQEMSEGSRCETLSELYADSEGNPVKQKEIELLDYGGDRSSVWSIATYAEINGVACSSDNVLTLNTAMDSSRYDTGDHSKMADNLYLTVTPKNSFKEESSDIKQLTDYQDVTSGWRNSISYSYLTKISDNRFLVSWMLDNETGERSKEDSLDGHKLHYMFVDGDGDALTQEMTAAASLSNCEPVVRNGKVYWYASDEYSLDFYSIDGSTGSFSKTVQFLKAHSEDMYRLYNPNSGEHFYTSSDAEKNKLIGLGWQDEGIGWYAPTKSDTPVYRMYNPVAGEHHYTMSEAERDNLKNAGWRYEGIGWYSDDYRTVPVYRQYNPNAFANNHNYTASESEKAILLWYGWRDENIGWYGMYKG